MKNVVFWYIKPKFVPHRKHTWASTTACYKNNFAFSYIDDVQISQETGLWASTAYNEYNFFIFRWCSYLTESTPGPPRLVTGIALLSYMR
jgi:hypothetical protein